MFPHNFKILTMKQSVLFGRQPSIERKANEWNARHVVSSLGVSTWEDWVPVCCVPFMFSVGPFLFSAFGVLNFFRVMLLVHKVSRSRFPFWCFRWVYLSLNFFHKLKCQFIDESRLRSRFFYLRCFQCETFLPLFLQAFTTEDRLTKNERHVLPWKRRDSIIFP